MNITECKEKRSKGRIIIIISHHHKPIDCGFVVVVGVEFAHLLWRASTGQIAIL